MRDETARVVQKARKGLDITDSTQPIVSSEPPTSRREQALSGTVVPPQAADLGIGKPRCSLVQPLQNAVTYFMTSFVKSSMFGRYLPGLYVANPQNDNALSSAVRAASFANFASRVRDSRFVDMGHREYSLALSRTNAALADCKNAVLDTTLAAVMVLGLFESIAFQGQSCLQNWMAHTSGTMELIRLRGREQLGRNISLQIVSHAYFNIRISCIHRSVAIPAELLSIDKDVCRCLESNDPTLLLFSIMNRTSNIKARLVNNSDPDLIYELMTLEEETEALMEKCSILERFPRLRRRVEPLFDTATKKDSLEAEAEADWKFARWWYAICIIRIIMIERVWQTISISAENMGDQNDDARDGTCYAYPNRVWLMEYARQKMVTISTDVLTHGLQFVNFKDSQGRFLQSARCMVCPVAFLQSSMLCPPEVGEKALILLNRLGEDLDLPQACHAATLSHPSRSSGDWWVTLCLN